MSETINLKKPVITGITLIIASLFGFYAAFALMMNKIKALTETGFESGCDFSVIVQCSANLDSYQGSIFGFPNPIIGLVAWPFVLVTGVLILMNVKLPKLYWGLFLAGTFAGLTFVAWLIWQSIYFLGTLCPWCMVTWVAMITTFFLTLVHSGSLSLFSQKSAKIFLKLKAYVPIIVFSILALIALLAQLRIDWIGTL